jgi:hypothetical protein
VAAALLRAAAAYLVFCIAFYDAQTLAVLLFVDTTDGWAWRLGSYGVSEGVHALALVPITGSAVWLAMRGFAKARALDGRLPRLG